MSAQPNVSLLIPVYNAAASLRLCLDSAAAQTLSELEILCLDDGSTDESRGILAEYARRDGRFRILEHPENRGSMAARRTLIREARGEYILFLDADDALEPDACARAYDRIRREKTDIVQFGMAIDAAPGTPEAVVKWFREFEKPCCRRLYGTEILAGCFLDRVISWNLVNKIYAAALLKRAAEYVEFPEKVIHAEDMYISFVAFSFAKSFAGFSRELYHYRFGYGVSGNVTSLEAFDKLRGEALVAEHLRGFARELGGPQKRREACEAAVELLMKDCVLKLGELPEEDREEGLSRMLSWWKDSPGLGILHHLAENTLGRCMDTDAAAPGEKKPVGVVFVANASFVPHAAVAARSVLDHASTDRDYRIYVLHDSIPPESAARLEAMGEGRGSVRCLNISSRIRQWLRELPTLPHITAETYYRFFIPEIFSGYERILYLDCDLVAEADVGELYDMPLGDALLAGVATVCKQWTADRVARDFCIDREKYLNAGVLLFHNRQILREGVDKRFFRFLADTDPKILFHSDEDVLNAVCRGRIVYADTTWNFLWNYLHGDPELAETARGAVERCRDRIRICHFASPLKPWDHPELELADRYWRYAARTSFFSETLLAARERIGGGDIPAVPVPLSEIEKIRRSASFRIGQLVTWAPRKIRGLIRCVKEHGWSYTLRRAVEHFGVPMDAALPRTTKTKPARPAKPPAGALTAPEIETSAPTALISVLVLDGDPERLSEGKNQSYSHVEILCPEEGGALPVLRGEYVCFLCAGDRWSPDFLEKMAARGERTGADVVVCGGEDLLRTSLLRGYEVFSRRELPEEILLFTPPVTGNKLFRRSFLEKNRLTFPGKDGELPFVGAALALAEGIACVNEPLAACAGGKTCLEETAAALAALGRTLEEWGIFPDVERSFGNLALGALAEGMEAKNAHALVRETEVWKRILRFHARPWYFDRAGYDRLMERMEPQRKKDPAWYAALPPDRYPEELIAWYGAETGDDLPLEHPVTFNEKLQWLKLYDCTPRKTLLADKYRVRDWVRETAGEEYLIPLLGVWDRFEDIDFSALPEQFVLKANDGSGRNIIVRDKTAFDAADARRKFAAWAREPFAFHCGFELHYRNIPPKILAEKYMENMDQLVDYKFLCFGGEVKLVWVDTDRFTRHHRTLFTPDWQRLDVTMGEYAPAPGEIPRPERLEEMLSLAERLSRGFAHVRVDLYEVDGRVYFGEMTFISTSGLDRASPRSFEKAMGDWLVLPESSPIPEEKTGNDHERERTQ